MKQLLTEAEIVGKTITSVISSSNNIWLKFSDGSFTVLDSENSVECFGYPTTKVVISDDIVDSTYKQLVELEIISIEAYKQALKDDEEDMKRRQEQWEEKSRQEAEKVELAYYKTLAKKYGKRINSQT